MAFCSPFSFKVCVQLRIKRRSPRHEVHPSNKVRDFFHCVIFINFYVHEKAIYAENQRR